jgi:hypothetical protein
MMADEYLGVVRRPRRSSQMIEDPVPDVSLVY